MNLSSMFVFSVITVISKTLCARFRRNVSPLSANVRSVTAARDDDRIKIMALARLQSARRFDDNDDTPANLGRFPWPLYRSSNFTRERVLFEVRP